MADITIAASGSRVRYQRQSELERVGRGMKNEEDNGDKHKGKGNETLMLEEGVVLEAIDLAKLAAR